MRPTLYFTLVLLTLLLSLPATTVQATEKVAEATATLAGDKPAEQKDTRVDHLRAYLRSHNSPLAEDAEVLIREADKHDLDWRLVASIAGLESTFGKHVPVGSYNAWGWGIPTGASSGIGFTSWKQGISTVSEGLRNRYINRGATSLEQIGRIYAASPTWAVRVRFFMEKIEEFKPTDPDHIAFAL